jgi:acyl-CoA thioester hydrolase
MDLVLTYRGTVMPWHCDHMGHMNVMWYVGKFDEATWALFGMLGLSSAYLRDNRRALAAVEQHLQYKRELVAGDNVAVSSGVLEIKEKAVRFFHEMRDALSGEVCATSRYVGVHLDAASRKSCPFPAGFAAHAKQFVRSYDF